MIKIDKVSFKYNKDTKAEVTALEDTSAVIKKGEFVAVLGHNGCGKSTLAKHLNALLLPSEGSVIVDDMNTEDPEKLWDIRKCCGMVFQNPDNQMVATVIEEEVAFGPENIGIEPQEIERRIEEALLSVGINLNMKKASSNLLSGGQKQRLAIAGIIAMHPEYIIFDEATSMLDPKGNREVLNMARKLNKDEGLTIIFITHSMEEAAMADRIIVMEKGKIVMEGLPKEIFSQVEKMQDLRLDVPPMTKLAYRLKNRGMEIPEDILTVEEMTNSLLAVLNG